MKYKLLGKSGLRVSELALGTMTFGTDWGWGADKETSRKIFNLFTEEGGNFIDTANNYTNGTSETFVGEFTAGHRDKFVIATKYTLNTQANDPNAGGNHRKNLVRSLEGSLRRLKTDYVDLLWLHAWDETTPIEEVMRALDNQVRAGKVLYVGVSDTPAWVVSRANLFAEFKGFSPFVGLQIQYSLLERTPERDLLPMAEALDLAVTPWGAIGAGILSGKYNRPDKPKDVRFTEGAWGTAMLTDRNLKIADAVGRLARESDRTPAQIAVNWSRQNRSGVYIPIIGARSETQFRDNLGCLLFEFSPEQIGRLSEASKIDLGFPHEFLKTDMVHSLIFGETYALVENHRKLNK